jgi:hypothetical protein
MRAGRLRKWAGAGLLAVLGVAPLRAQEPSPPKPAPPVPGVVEQKPSVPSPQFSPVDPAAAAAGADCACANRPAWSGLFVDADYLLIKPRRTALDYAISAPNTDQVPAGNIESIDWQIRSGFRFGAGYEFPDQGWALSAHYTYLHSTEASSVTAPSGGTVYATLTRSGTFDQVDAASASAGLNYNVLDFEASKRFAPCASVDVDVFGGVRIAWIDQNFSAVYNGGPGGAVNATVDSPVYFNGAGLTLGAEATWKLTHGLGIYGRARASILSGQFHNVYNETNNNGQTSIVNVTETYDQLVPVMELGVGVSWRTEHVQVSVGYDLADWFNMVNSPAFTSTNIGTPVRRTSDLMLEGLSFQVGVMF